MKWKDINDASSGTFEENIEDHMVYANIHKSALYRIAWRYPVFPCADMIDWSIQSISASMSALYDRRSRTETSSCGRRARVNIRERAYERGKGGERRERERRTCSPPSQDAKARTSGTPASFANLLIELA